ncbi:hypothetical protein [Fimbriiglobus ruber]|uniref:Cobalamin B12-binding domain protein n=1 Tax=Fimbriiglobus ruber TaxID=1908690 RepID=A0A225DCQ7_9BACT|nr:hypothetical protein [Fimbriiglobus ruber]OWK34175.1 cobalamin B12-binding domain protein [Fimbriiglobus ruber]
MMSEKAVARFILSQRPALAQAVVVRLYGHQPELRQRYGDDGMAKCVHDTKYSLSHLAAALTYSCPAIFTGYIAWVKNVLQIRNVRLEGVDDNLWVMGIVLREQFPDGCTAALTYLDDAIRTPPQGASECPPLFDGDNPLSTLARGCLRALLLTERHK